MKEIKKKQLSFKCQVFIVFISDQGFMFWTGNCEPAALGPLRAY